MLLELSVQHCLSQEIKGMEIIGKRKLYGPFFWMGFNCLKATEPLQGDSLLFTIHFPAVSGIQLIDLEKVC